MWPTIADLSFLPLLHFVPALHASNARWYVHGYGAGRPLLADCDRSLAIQSQTKENEWLLVKK